MGLPRLLKTLMAIVLLVAPLVFAQQLELVELWHSKVRSSIYGLAFSDSGNLGVASGHLNSCAYVFSPRGYMLSEVCGSSWMYDASYSNGMFAFVNWDGYVYITNENGDLIKKIYVGEQYNKAVTLRDNNFIACGTECALFNLKGNKLWVVDVGYVLNKPSYSKGYWYIADRHREEVIIVKDGNIINKIVGYGERVYDTAVCDHYLAVSTWSYVYLYDISEPSTPKLIWREDGFDEVFQVAFSPDCRYIAITDTGNHELKVYDIRGNLVSLVYYGDDYDDKVWSVAWWKDRIAVGLEGGDIYVYKVEGYEPIATQPLTTACKTVTSTVTTTETVTQVLTTTAYETLTVAQTVTQTPACRLTKQQTIPSSPLLEPYLKLKELYQTLSKSTGYKATVLKGPFQANIAYLATLAQFGDLYSRLESFRSELKASLSQFEKLMNEQPTFENVYAMMNLIQKAKVDLAMLKNTLAQMEQIVKEMKASLPAVSCDYEKAKEIVEGILKASKIKDIIAYREEAAKMGGLDKVVKCLIKWTMLETVKEFQKMDKSLKAEINEYQSKVSEYEKLVSLLSVR